MQKVVATYSATHSGPTTTWEADVVLTHRLPDANVQTETPPYTAWVAIDATGDDPEAVLDKLADYCERTAKAIRARSKTVTSVAPHYV